ncbi:MAG: hypothetical protein ACXU9J_07680 [Syntrophales bacterium]
MIPKLIVAVDGMSFHDAEEKGVFSSLSEAIVKSIIWGIKIVTCCTAMMSRRSCLS